MKRTRVQRIKLLLLLVGFVLMLGTSQAERRALLPDRLWLELPDAPLAFDLSSRVYPSLEAAVRYRLAAPEGRILLRLSSTLERPWSLLLSVPDLVPVGGFGESIPAQNIRYRVNGATWLQADGTPQVIYSALGPTPALEPTVLWLEFELEVPGAVGAGAYWLDAEYSALVMP